MINSEQQEKIMRAVGDHLAEHIERSVPVTIAFKPCICRFDICESENEGMMRLSCHAPGELSLQLGVFRKGTDRLYSNYLPSAAAEDMIRYLRDSASHRDWSDAIAQLSRKVDDFWA